MDRQDLNFLRNFFFKIAANFENLSGCDLITDLVGGSEHRVSLKKGEA